jgi:hypothetical protein
MNKTETNEENLQMNTINAILDPVVNKIKKKKKKSKKPKEKKCKDLKELLDQINKEKEEKLKKQEEKKNLKIDIPPVVEPQANSGSLTPIESEDRGKDFMIKDYLNAINNSVSGTTVATLSHEDEFQKFNFDRYSSLSKFEYGDLRPNYLVKTSELSDEEKNREDEPYYCKRKKSSPICDYYCGYDKILSEMHKGSVDMSNSMNFIKKEDFISSNVCMNNNNFSDLNYYFNPEVNNHKNNNNNIDEINNTIDKDNEDKKNDMSQIDMDKNILNNVYNNKTEYDHMNMSYYPYYDYYNIYPEFNTNSKFSLNNEMVNINDGEISNSISHIYKIHTKKLKYKENKENKKDKNKPKNATNKNKKDNYPYLSLRKGDWLCQFCSNLNFSFRSFCNRCRAPKQ